MVKVEGGGEVERERGYRRRRSIDGVEEETKNFAFERTHREAAVADASSDKTRAPCLSRDRQQRGSPRRARRQR